MNSWRYLSALLAAAMLAMVSLLTSCSMPELTRVSAETMPTPESCAHCHVDIYTEWKQSPHARAYTNPRYVMATDDHQFAACVSCHAPQPRLTASEPTARRSDRELGVVCVACHMDQGAMVGPLPPTGMVKPHPIRVDPAPFEDGALCGRCHQGTLVQWRQAKHEPGEDCRQCHMPPVERKTTQATSAISKLFVAAERPAHEHEHSFLLTPIDQVKSRISLDVVHAGGQVSVTLTNQLPHNLPTGDFGMRLVVLSVTGQTSDGSLRTLGSWELTNFAGGPLPSGQSRTWSAVVPDDIGSIDITVERFGRDGTGRTLLLRRQVALR